MFHACPSIFELNIQQISNINVVVHVRYATTSLNIGHKKITNELIEYLCFHILHE